MREIDEAVRQDDTLQFFQKYGVALGSAVALIIVGMLYFVGALFNWKWLLKPQRSHFKEEILGEMGTRIGFALIAIAMIIVGVTMFFV